MLFCLKKEASVQVADSGDEVDVDSSNTNHGVSGWVYDVSDLLG